MGGTTAPRPTRFVQVIVILAALSMLVTGVWMRIDPTSFAQWANWPNHDHFLHDAGVFQIGIGLTMVFALWWPDVIAVALAGFLVANTAHAMNHALDTYGGRPADSWLLGALSVLAGVGLILRLRQLKAKDTGANRTAGRVGVDAGE